jgi:hypothetical protein
LTSRAKKLLSYKLADYIALGTPGQVLTIDEAGYPHTSFTWVTTNSIHLLRFGADQGSPTMANIDRSGHAAVQIITDEGQPYLIKGVAAIANSRIESAPFAMALAEMEILEVLDQSWIGVSVNPFDYEWAPEDQEEMLEIQLAVYTEMREWVEQ